jgi:hypothetical protein
MKIVVALILFPLRLLVVVALLISLGASSISAAFQDHDQSRLPS